MCDDVYNSSRSWFSIFGRPFVKRFALCYQTVVYLSVCPVCNVGVLWPNGWMDQDETLRAGSPRPWPHCVRWGPSYPSPKRHNPQFLAHICSGQMAGWIKMPVGREVGLGPSDFVLDGDPAPLPKKGAEPPIFGPCLLWPNGCMDQDATWYGGTVGLDPCHMSPPKKRGQPPIFGPCLLW